jgi:hypothetical protein
MAVSASLAQLTTEKLQYYMCTRTLCLLLMLTSTLRQVQKYQMSHLAINVTTT